MAEENSAGSGFGKLVYGTLKGNGINTEGMSFDEAVKKFKELGGTDNWHAKIMKREANEKQAKEESANATKNVESQNQKQIPKEFKKNKDNHYEYGGAVIKESEYEDGLVEVSIKGHTIMASDLEDAKKTIDEFNGTESTDPQKQTAKDNRAQQIAELKAKINEMDANDPNSFGSSKRAELVRKKNEIEDSIKAEENLKVSKEKYPVGSQIHDIYRREWLEVVGYDERTGDVRLRGNSGTIYRRMNAEALDKLYDASPINKPREEKENKKQTSANETPNEYKGYKIEPGQYGLLKISHPSGTFYAADYEDAKNKIEYYDEKAEKDRKFNESLKTLAQETAKRKASLTEEDKANQRKYWARRKPGKLY